MRGKHRSVSPVVCVHWVVLGSVVTVMHCVFADNRKRVGWNVRKKDRVEQWLGYYTGVRKGRAGQDSEVRLW